MYFIAKKDVPKGDDYEEIKKDSICECGIFEGCRSIFRNGEYICDFDSNMALEYFEKVEEKE